MSGPSPLALAHRLVADLRFGEAAAQFGLAADQTEDVGVRASHLIPSSPAPARPRSG